jgi:hypothetical protein
MADGGAVFCGRAHPRPGTPDQMTRQAIRLSLLCLARWHLATRIQRRFKTGIDGGPLGSGPVIGGSQGTRACIANGPGIAAVLEVRRASGDGREMEILPQSRFGLICDVGGQFQEVSSRGRGWATVFVPRVVDRAGGTYRMLIALGCCTRELQAALSSARNNGETMDEARVDELRRTTGEHHKPLVISDLGVICLAAKRSRNWIAGGNDRRLYSWRDSLLGASRV